MKLVRDILKPSFVLILVCAVISGALALTYNLTGVAELGSGFSPEELQQYSAEALPEADKLVTAKVSIEDEHLLQAFKAENGAGMALIINAKGYSSDGITMMIGLNPDGAVQGISVIAQTETPGIGDKVIENKSFLDSFIGNTKGSVNTDIIAGATKTSKGLISGVEIATTLFDQLKGEVLG